MTYLNHNFDLFLHWRLQTEPASSILYDGKVVIYSNLLSSFWRNELDNECNANLSANNQTFLRRTFLHSFTTLSFTGQGGIFDNNLPISVRVIATESSHIEWEGRPNRPKKTSVDSRLYARVYALYICLISMSQCQVPKPSLVLKLAEEPDSTP